MEDRVVAVPNLVRVGGKFCGFFAVLDGHEGEAAAQFVAEELPRAVAERLVQLARRRDGGSGAAVESAIRDALAATDARLLHQAAQQGLRDGTTAVFVLLCGQQYLVGSIGDSFAILCSRRQSLDSAAAEERQASHVDSSLSASSSASDPAILASEQGAQTAAARRVHSSGGSRGTHGHILSAVHSPGREDERRRIEAAGGFVRTTADGRPRLQGELTLSRALGDLPYRNVGLIATPEFSGWHTLTPDDKFLILASDGLLDSVSAQEACASAAALAAGRRLPLKPPWSSSAIALGPAAGGNDVSSAAAAGLQQNSHQCWARAGIFSCLDCCPGCVSNQPSGPATLPQTIAEVLQEAAYNRTSLDNISVLVIDLRGADDDKRAASRGHSVQHGAGNASAASAEEPQPGTIVAASGSPQGYELVQQLSPVPQPQQQAAVQRLNGGSAQTSPASARQSLAGPADLHAVAQRWLEADGGSSDIRGFCAAQIHTLPLMQLGPAETALIESLAGLPMMLEEAAPQPDGFCTRRRGGGGRSAGGACSRDGNRKSGRGGGGGSFRQNLENWNLEDSFAKGHFGEVWHGMRRQRRSRGSAADAQAGQHFVLKRLLVEHGMEARLSGLREAYFGQLLQDTAESPRTCVPAAGRLCIDHPGATITHGAEHIVRFVESFETRDHALWLVFHDEGRSLHTLMYGKGFAAGGQKAAEGESAASACGQETAEAESSEAAPAADSSPANAKSPAAAAEPAGRAAQPGSPGAFAAGSTVDGTEATASSSGGSSATAGSNAGDGPQSRQTSVTRQPSPQSPPPPPEASPMPKFSGLQRAGAAAATGIGSQGQLVSQTEWWWALRKDRQGDEVMREILRQMLAGLAAVHAHNVTHRDLKPENLLLSEPTAGGQAGAAADAQQPSAEAQQGAAADGRDRPAADTGQDASTSGRDQGSTEHPASADGRQQTEQRPRMPHVRLIDFGSAVDQHSFETLYGADGPSEDEQTPEYAPPEATFGTYWHSSSAVGMPPL